MANTGFLSVSETDFDNIKTNLKTYLKSRPEFTDYDFDGSNLSALLDVLSYNTYMNAFYLNMIGSEMFLDSAQIKSSVVSHAKELNYVPRSRSSARAKVNFTVNTGNDFPNLVVIPEDYTVTATVDNVKLEFHTDSAITLTTADNITFTTVDPVYVYEGKVVEEFFTVGTNTKYVLQSTNIDTNSIKVVVINSQTDSTNTVYTYAENIYGKTGNSQVFYVQGYNNDQYEVVFGDNVIGKALQQGNIVKVKYRSTNGEAGNKAYTFNPSSQINGKYPVTVSTIVAAADGSEREDINSIKLYAPRNYTVQDRAVTKEDYINLVRSKYPQIKTIGVYGGEDADPPQYGKVILTLVPYGSAPVVSKELKEDIIKYLTTKTITTEPLIYDPEYLYIEVISKVIYDPNQTTKTAQQIESDIINVIKNYDTSYLTEFGNDFRKSKLTSMIDTADASIVSNQTNVRAIYKITPRRSVKERVEFSFSNALYRPLKYPYNVGESEVLKSSTFTYVKNNTAYTAVLSDDGIGNLRVYYSSPGSPVVILEPNVGTVDYTTGKVVFDLNIYNYIQSIDIYAVIDTNDILVNESKFLRIDYSKIQVSATTV